MIHLFVISTRSQYSHRQTLSQRWTDTRSNRFILYQASATGRHCELQIASLMLHTLSLPWRSSACSVALVLVVVTLLVVHWHLPWRQREYQLESVWPHSWQVPIDFDQERTTTSTSAAGTPKTRQAAKECAASLLDLSGVRSVPVALAWYSMNLFDRVFVSVDLVSVCDYAVTGLRLQTNESFIWLIHTSHREDNT